MILAALNLPIAVNIPQKHFALSLPCDWLTLKLGRRNGPVRIWWPTGRQVRIYLSPQNRSGLPSYPDKETESSWITHSKLPAQDIMPDPPHFGKYTLPYIFLKMQVRTADFEYCLVTGVIKLQHWYQTYPDHMTKGQAALVKSKSRLMYEQDENGVKTVSYVFEPPGQTSEDPMLVCIQLPAVPEPILNQVHRALNSLTIVPKNFRVPIEGRQHHHD